MTRVRWTLWLLVALAAALFLLFAVPPVVGAAAVLALVRAHRRDEAPAPRPLAVVDTSGAVG